LLWALLPLLDARVPHRGAGPRAEPASNAAVVAAAGDDDAGVDRCELCDLLNTWGGSPSIPVRDQSAVPAREVPAEHTQRAANAGVRVRTFARAPPIA
jgi:hypothetical protein